MANPFAALLVRLRAEAGHASANAFFQANGGRAHFGCTYKQYQNVESGRSLPGPLLVERAAAALRVWQDQKRGREFTLAYLKTVVGREGLVDFLAASLSGALPGATPLRQALQRHGVERTVFLTKEQSRLIRSNKQTQLCFLLLASDSGHHDAHALTRLVGCSAAAAGAALRKLEAAKILARDKEGLYYCPKAGWIFRHPREELYRCPEALSVHERWWEGMAKAQGDPLLHHFMLVRASESSLRSYFPYMTQTVDGVDVYSALEKGPDTAVFLVEALARRVLPF